MPSARLSAAALLLLAAFLPLSPGMAQDGGFVVRLGNDTVAVERVSRTAERIDGELLRRIPATHVISYFATLDAQGQPEEFSFALVRPGGLPTPGGVRGGRIVFGVDSARVEIERDSVTTRTVAAPAAFPALPESYGLYELWLAGLRRSGQDSVIATIVAPLGGPAGRIRVRAHGADSVLVPFAGGMLRLWTGRQGELLGLDGRATTIKYEVERVAPVDVMPLAERFAAREAGEGVLGTWVSPRDTVIATVGGATLWVDYGRPAARGRDVFANGVLGDTLWRTGANAATQFRTDRDLVIGGAPVPAGTYTLWTWYDAGRATLVINAQTGQWGTQYDRERDVVRIPLRVRRVPDTPAELFTIAVRPAGGGGMLELAWDRTVMDVAFEVRP